MATTPQLVFTDAATGAETVVQGNLLDLTGGNVASFDNGNTQLATQVRTIYAGDLPLARADRDFNDLVLRLEDLVPSEGPGSLPAAAPEPELHRIEPGDARTRLASPAAGREVLDLEASGLGLATLDSNGDRAVGRGDALVRAHAHRVRIDLGAAAGEAAGIDIPIVEGTPSLGEEAFG